MFKTLMCQLARRTPASSPAELVAAALSNPQTYRSVVVHLLSAVATLALHVITAYFLEPTAKGEPNLGVFVKSRWGQLSKRLYFHLSSCLRKHPYYLNGRLLFLLVIQITAALAYCLRVIMLDRFVFGWPFAVVCLRFPRSMFHM